MHKIILSQNSKFKGEFTFIYDYDSLLNFPSEFERYYNKSIDFPKKFNTIFRVINFSLFLDYFASDRSHMIMNIIKKGTNKEKICYMKPIPNYPSIINKDKEIMNLNCYLDINEKNKNFGGIFDEKNFFQFFRNKKLF